MGARVQCIHERQSRLGILLEELPQRIALHRPTDIEEARSSRWTATVHQPPVSRPFLNLLVRRQSVQYVVEEFPQRNRYVPNTVRIVVAERLVRASQKRLERRVGSEKQHIRLGETRCQLGANDVHVARLLLRRGGGLEEFDLAVVLGRRRRGDQRQVWGKTVSYTHL